MKFYENYGYVKYEYIKLFLKDEIKSVICINKTAKIKKIFLKFKKSQTDKIFINQSIFFGYPKKKFLKILNFM